MRHATHILIYLEVIIGIKKLFNLFIAVLQSKPVIPELHIPIVFFTHFIFTFSSGI